MDEFKYRAFLSYTHADKDHAFRLHRVLENYRVPRGISSPRLVDDRRLGRFFLDDAELGGVPGLGPALRVALEESESLIVLCSPMAANSKWVEEEIRHFTSTHPDNPRVFAVVLSGTPDAGEGDRGCLPPSLALAMSEEISQAFSPLALDAQQMPYVRLTAKLVAGLVDVDFDALWNRDRRRRRTRRMIATSGFVAVSALLSGLLYSAQLTSEATAQAVEAEEQASDAVTAARTAKDEKRASDAKRLAHESINLSDSPGKETEALLRALESASYYADEEPLPPETSVALTKSLGRVHQQIPVGGGDAPFRPLAFSPTSPHLVVQDASFNLGVVDTKDGVMRDVSDVSVGRVSKVRFDEREDVVCIVGPEGAVAVLMHSGEVIDSRTASSGRLWDAAVTEKKLMTVVSNEDGSLELTRSGEVLTLRSPFEGAEIVEGAFAPKHDRLFALDDGQRLYSWRIGDGKYMGSVSLSIESFDEPWFDTRIFVSPQGATVATLAGSPVDAQIEIWNATNLQRVGAFDSIFSSYGGIQCENIELSADGSRALVVYQTMERIGDQFWAEIYDIDIETGRVSPVNEMLGPGLDYECDKVHMSPDGRRVSFVVNGVVRIYPASGGEEPLLVHGVYGGLEEYLIGPSGESAALDNGTSYVSVGRPAIVEYGISDEDGGFDRSPSIHVDDEGRLIVNGAAGGPMRVDLGTGRVRRFREQANRTFLGVSDGKRIFVSRGHDDVMLKGDHIVFLDDESEVTVFSARDGVERARYKKDGFINSVEISDDGGFVGTAEKEMLSIPGEVHVRKMPDLTEVVVCEGAFEVDFCPSRPFVACSGYSGVEAWDLSRNASVFKVGREGAWRVAVSPDCELVASQAKNGTVEIWSIDPQKMLHTLGDGNTLFEEVEFGPEGKFFAASTNDGKVMLWRVEDWSLMGVFEGSAAFVRSISFFPGGDFLSSTTNHGVTVWPLRQSAWLERGCRIAQARSPADVPGELCSRY